MKQFSKILLNVTLISISVFMQAQDTIYFKNKIIVSAKIIEIGITEIKYKHFDNPEGPTYSNSKNEIEKIKYVNGIIDTIPYVDSKIKDSTDIGLKYNTINGNKLVLVGTELYYDNKILGQLKTHHLLKNKALSTNQINLIKEIKSLKQREQGYNALGTGLFLTGFAIPVVTTLGVLSASASSTNYTNGVQTIVAGAIIGAVFRIAGHVVAKVNKNKSKARKLAFLRNHSQSEIID